MAVTRCAATSCGWRSSAAYNVEKKQGRPLTDDEYVAVLSREVKTRRESVEAFRARWTRGPRGQGRGRDRGARRSTFPSALTDAEIEALVAEGVAATGASSARDLGKVMGWLAPRTRGRADGKRVSELVAQTLAQADLATHDVGGH